MKCRIVIVGRPNVGKSTLFNRLFGRKRALVHNEPGVTRDRLEEQASWWIGGDQFPVALIDTGGLGGEKFSVEIKKQVNIALEDADIVLFVFDSQVGLTPLDQDLLRELKRSGIRTNVPLVGVVNKVDTESHETRHIDFFETGLDPVLTISAEHGRGIDDLKTKIAELAGFVPNSKKNTESESLESNEDNDEESEEEEDDAEELLDEENESEDVGNEEENEEAEKEARPHKGPPRIAIVGRPNVGKSTLMNAILGEDRMITSPIAGTTIDSVDSLHSIDGKMFHFIDTAGIRKKGKTEQGVEVLSVVQTRKALEHADIAILVVDGEVGILDQDEKISGLIQEVGCSVVLLVNKWDKHDQNKKFTTEIASERIRKEMGHLKYAPILFVSALRRRGLRGLGELLQEIMEQRQVKVSTHEFSEWIREQVDRNNPRGAKFFLSHQSGRHPPTFVCHVNDSKKVHFSLQRHLVNGIRERWGFMGSPIRIYFIEGKNTRAAPRSSPGKKHARRERGKRIAREAGKGKMTGLKSFKKSGRPKTSGKRK